MVIGELSAHSACSMLRMTASLYPSGPKLVAANRWGIRVQGHWMSHWISYAVGDIHGRFDLLEMALIAIDDHADTHDRDVRLVFLGDYVDRGPDSRRVVETL